MLNVSSDFLAEAVRDGNEPLLYMDIWPDKGPRDRLSSSSNWSGANDPAQTSDVGVSATRKRGVLMLGNGTAAPVTGSGFTALVAHSLNYRMDVTAHYLNHGLLHGGTKFDHLTWAEITRDAEQIVPFISNSTFLMSTIRIVAQNTGNSATSATVRITDAKGNQVGNMGSVAIAASSGQLTLDIAGLNASLQKGFRYRLVLGYTIPSSPGRPWIMGVTSYTVALAISSYAIGAYTHTIALSDGSGFVIGGQNGYAATGHSVRSLDVLSVPTGTGVITFSDVVPGGADPTTMAITLYYTDSAVIAAESALTNWTLHQIVLSGGSIPAHRYWRAKIDMTSNALNDETPELSELLISYIGSPITFGSRMETAIVPGTTNQVQVSVLPGLDSVSTATAQITPKPSKSMIGRVSVILMPEPAVDGLMAKKLRGRPVTIRAGYSALAETIDYYSGIVRDMAWNRGKYTLTLTDTIELADVSVPRIKAGAPWSSTVNYTVASNNTTFFTYGMNSWKVLIASGPAHGGAVTPGTNAAVWQDSGTVWQDIGYTAATNGGTDWHLADISKDLIINRINIQSQHVNFASLEAMNTRWTNRTGTRELTKPAKVFGMLSEIAWLLEGQWVVQSGQLTLLPEPLATDLPIESISADDVAAGVGYRRGWADMKNESLIITGYSGVGDSNAQFSGGEVVADITSINDYEMVALDTFHDKWNVPESELTVISTNFVNRWKDGRRVVPSSKIQMRLLRMEPGDVVMFDSLDLPTGDQGPYKMMVLKKDLNWKRQALSMSFIEVQ